MSVCDACGGKSTTYDKVISPIILNFMSATGLNINLKNYTTAWIQNHQIRANGYGMITSDEGQWFLNSIHVKQRNGE